ncbi:hypothetical protein MBAV_005301 [Candidatus Magnetobacterium bavaricum]|uniref:Uncharacterized protein n=1 Tax=Candidatus Magnetobacterium bavaricum TaxID=29290 RepID=A0A0F3GKZ5_9BACT|nr:hypothetical protein MBAV_005301 [Candidatus Magnetobacterium bavaricum]
MVNNGVKGSATPGIKGGPAGGLAGEVKEGAEPPFFSLDAATHDFLMHPHVTGIGK